MGSLDHQDDFASEDGYSIPDTPMGTARHLKIICIGAGASGLNLAYQIRKNMRNVDLVIYEKNGTVGGTWYENRWVSTVFNTSQEIS